MSAVRADAAPSFIDRETLEGLDTLARSLDRDQLIWSSGYLAGLAAGRGAAERSAAASPALAAHAIASAQAALHPAGAAEPVAEASPWLILYATETGNCRRIAQALDQQMRDAGLATQVANLHDYDPKALRRAKQATFVVATHGLGDPPEGTEPFFQFLRGDRAPKLEQLRYSVLALGDSSYEEFCAIGRELDERLEALGARRIHDRAECDVDFDDTADAWREGVLRAIKESAPKEPRLAVASLHPAYGAEPAPQRAAFGRANPFPAEVLVNQKITGRESSKDVRHLELSLEGSELEYLPGDAIGVWPENPPELADALIGLLKLDAEAEVRVGGEASSLRDALLRRLEITKLSRGFAQAYADAANVEELKAVLASSEASREYLGTRQIIDVVAEHPGSIGAQAFAAALRKITPRLYSVASSLEANPDEAHLTVGVVSYERFGRSHCGAASAFLASDTARVQAYVEANENFRLPADGDAPVIMIGAGTGVAPYRAFLQHRKLQGGGGGNWLIFGDRTMRADFLYQVEWLRHLKEGALTRLTVAFSRDQQHKIYVQDRIAEHAEELYDWLERGAHLYVCGEAENMAPAVHAALAGVVERVGGKSAERAQEYLQQLKTERRYQRDVY
jgi:sulfite reductase (NADPH) flavoprotein alpha-component